jgi:hypothetical protein
MMVVVAALVLDDAATDRLVEVSVSAAAELAGCAAECADA